MSNKIPHRPPDEHHRAGARSVQGRREKRRGLPDLVAQWFYKHGLFLSSYPTCASSIAIIVIFLSCYPLLNIPLPGTIPTRVVLPSATAESMGYGSLDEQGRNFSLVKNILNMNNMTLDTPFPWAQSSPFVYVQQIIMKSSVHPWRDELRLMDAYRGPIYQVFRLLEVVRNHEESTSKISLDHICLHVENVKRSMKEDIFPEYNCLVLSPANLWRQNVQNFSKDPNILNTVYQYHNIQKTKVSVAEMLFGLPMQETGFKRYPIKSRSRVIQYALTLILTKNDPKYLESLKQKLRAEFPLYQDVEDASTADTSNDISSSSSKSVMFIYYPGEFRLMEFVPIITAFIILFIYINFSLRKLEMVKSRIILASFAVITILGSLMMSLGLCFFFGLTITLQSKGIFPYLVILVGLENCLVITKSVVTTDEAFDIKIRVAQGLSREGWHISKTLLTEITILTIGLATFVPVIQEFCIFAIVGLISDFFLQMLLFSTILALDIKRIEYTAEAKYMPKIMSFAFNDIAKRNQRKYFDGKRNHSTGFSRSHSQPKLGALDSKVVQGPDGVNVRVPNKIPKRLKVVNFWTRTRFFQRAFMIWMSIWILSIIYSSGFLQNLFLVASSNETESNIEMKTVNKKSNRENLYTLNIPNTQQTSERQQPVDDKFAEQLKKLRHPGYEINYALSNFHWSTILKQYNISLSGKYVMILPSIKLSYAVKPEVAVHLRHPQEKDMTNFQWKALAAALDPLDFSDDDERKDDLHIIPPGGIPMFPKSPMEIFLATVLCVISVSVLTYALIVFYRCICTRNYAEWRASWNEVDPTSKNTERILEGVPIQVKGHSHKIECLVSDGLIVVSSCLKGQIKIWDSKTGELLTDIDRTNIMREMQNMQQYEMNYVVDIAVDDRTLPKKVRSTSTSPVWCLDYLDNLVAVGCANGRLEFWEAPTGSLKCTYDGDLSQTNGVTHINLNSDRVIVARLCGRLDFYKLETYYKGVQIDWGFTSAYRRTHARTNSTGSLGIVPIRNNCKPNTKEEMRCLLENSRMAHQQPLTCMEVVNGIILTGSQDHTLKVYRLEDLSVEHTLHGHCGPITCLFVDQWQFGTGGSGSQDGLLCVWDLFSGGCLYSIQAHYGAITSLACAPSYIISAATDERVCVWERFQGNLLCTISITNAYTHLLMLTPSLLVTSKMGSLIVWDVRTGEPTKEVKLDCAISQLCPKYMILVSNSVICDYGNELRIVKFPMVADKCN